MRTAASITAMAIHAPAIASVPVASQTVICLIVSVVVLDNPRF
jgi:hypothetical protein